MGEIEIIGEDISEVNFGFSVGDNFASKVGDALWFSPLKMFQSLFFRTPLVYLFVLGSFFYHDYLWWPMKGKQIQRDMISNTKWGRLFESYSTAEKDRLENTFCRKVGQDEKWVEGGTHGRSKVK
jgi:hypothetical protein